MDTIRNSAFGQVVNQLSSRKLFQHPEEQKDFVIPEKYLARTSRSNSQVESADLLTEKSKKADADADYELTFEVSQSSFGNSVKLEEGKDTNKNPDSNSTKFIVVDWYGPNDQENPQNWSQVKKAWIMVSVALLTTSIYMGSSIFSPGLYQIMHDLNTSHVKAILPLTVFILGYGIGPMALSPLSEHAPLGRTWIYIITLLLFVLIQIPTALVDTIEKIIGLRFIAGILASPPLSTGGATIGDTFTPNTLYIGILLWGISAFSGPALGPLVGGILTQLVNWRWTFWFLGISTGFAFIVLFFFLPETNAATILHRRAFRLRRLTGNQLIKSPFEVSQELEPQSAKEIITETFWRPVYIAFFEPMVFFLNLYCAFIYIIINSWFEAFPIVFNDLYHFDLIESGLTYLAVLIGPTVGGILYLYMVGRILKTESPAIERFLIPAMVGSFFLPAGLFIFAWGASTESHWIAPVIGAFIFCIGAINIFQSIFAYLGRGYFRFLASVYAGNCLMRSWMAAVFPVFVTPMFTNLGSEKFPVGAGGSILAAVSVLMIPIPFVFYRYGVKLRGRSKYAN